MTEGIDRDSASEYWKDVKPFLKREAEKEREARYARDTGLRFQRFEDGGQYNITYREKGWLWQFYPGNCRIYTPKNKNRTPFLSLLEEPTILDVVKAIAEIAHD